VVNHESGTANFKYLPASDLTVGYHMVYAVAYDLDNKASKPSVTINFYITDPSFCRARNYYFTVRKCCE